MQNSPNLRHLLARKPRAVCDTGSLYLNPHQSKSSRTKKRNYLQTQPKSTKRYGKNGRSIL